MKIFNELKWWRYKYDELKKKRWALIMNNETIELLLYKLEQNYKCEKENYFILYKPDIKDLLDYITTLQQENEKLKERCDYLQRSCDRKEEQRDDAVMEYMLQDDYKERNEKAIEIIEKYKKDEGLTMYHDTWQHLYPVYFALKGDDENEEK